MDGALKNVDASTRDVEHRKNGKDSRTSAVDAGTSDKDGGKSFVDRRKKDVDESKRQRDAWKKDVDGPKKQRDARTKDVDGPKSEKGEAERQTIWRKKLETGGESPVNPSGSGSLSSALLSTSPSTVTTVTLRDVGTTIHTVATP